MQNHTTSVDVDDGQVSPLNDDVAEDGQRSPLGEDVVDNGQLSPIREDDVVVDHVPRALPPLVSSRLEVFSVRIMNTNGQHGDHLYGEIKVDNTIYEQHIYNRNRENSESISPGDIVLLTGPTRSITVYDSFLFDLALMYEYHDCLLEDEVISRQIHWDHWKLNYNTLQVKEIKGLFGRVIMDYVVLSEAVEATLDVTLINGDEENLVRLRGQLTARNGYIMDESVLFRKTLAEDIAVWSGQLIPLSRSAVAVPTHSCLIVEAKLWDSFTDHEIANGIVEFPPQFYGTSKKNISGEYGEIRVEVTWVT